MSSVVVSTTTSRRLRADAAWRCEHRRMNVDGRAALRRRSVARPRSTRRRAPARRRRAGRSRAHAPRRDADDARVEIEVARECPLLLVEQVDEAAGDVAEADENRSKVIVRSRGGCAASPRAASREQIAQAAETGAQVGGLVAESDAQIAVHAEVIAGHDEHALLVAQPVHELGRIDARARSARRRSRRRRAARR